MLQDADAQIGSPFGTGNQPSDAPPLMQQQASNMAMPVVELTPNQTVAELLKGHPVAARVLLSHRMHCVGCDIASFETIADACATYDVPVDELLAEIQRASVREGEIG